MMMIIDKTMRTYILLAILTVWSGYCLYIPVNDRPVCFIINEHIDQEVYFHYQVSGSSTDEEFTVDFRSQTANPYIFSMKGSEGQTHFRSQKMHVCLNSLDGTGKSVSVDFYAEDTKHLVDLASKNDLYKIHSKLIDVGRKIGDVNRDQKFEQERSAIHTQYINQQQSKIKLVVYVKIVMIVAVALAQLYLLIILLNKPRKGYQAV